MAKMNIVVYDKNMRDTVYNVYKKIGETPLACIQRLRVTYPELKNKKLTYAGRLDPLAEGVLIILADESIKRKKEYLSLPKEYKFDILFGVATDTHDILGKITKLSLPTEILPESLKSILLALIGSATQTYPAYSSKTVRGKHLFEWARGDRLTEIDIPNRQVEIFSLDIVGSYVLTSAALANFIADRISKVHGDFRQDEIRQLWKLNFARIGSCRHHIYTLKVSCSSGTYVRALALLLDTSAVALHIKRVSVGDYTLKQSLKLPVPLPE